MVLYNGQFKIISNEHIRSITDSVHERAQGCGGTSDRKGWEPLLWKLWQKRMRRMTWAEAEYFFFHKLDNTCSSLELNTFSVLLQNMAWCQINLHCVGRAAPVPCVHLLMAQGEHLLHGRDPSASKAFVVLAHFDGLQPLGHRPEHGAVTAAGAGQADGHSWIKVSNGFQRLWASEQFVQNVDDVCEARSFGAVVLPTLKHELVDCGRAVHRSRKPEGLIDSLHDLMVAHVPVGPFSKCHNFPHDNAEAPHIAG